MFLCLLFMCLPVQVFSRHGMNEIERMNAGWGGGEEVLGGGTCPEFIKQEVNGGGGGIIHQVRKNRYVLN
jgi:hypothetical protein